MNFKQAWPKNVLAATVILTASVMPLLTQAQQIGAASAAPPDLEPLNDDEPAVTIRKPGEAQTRGNSITERRERGRTTEIRVQSGPSTYYLKPKPPLGSAMPGDAQSGPPTSAQWQVKEFDWSEKKIPKEGEEDTSAP